MEVSSDASLPRASPRMGEVAEVMVNVLFCGCLLTRDGRR